MERLNSISIKKVHTILYVENQDKSTQFYQELLQRKADLYVPGMTEFNLGDCHVLGLMPNVGISRILQEKTPLPETGTGIPRCELYFYVDDLEAAYQNAISCGCILISSIEQRNWGDNACYFADPDGHIIAFAKKI